MNHARAILWAQWRSVRNFYPRAGAAWTGIIGALWYGFWSLAAIAVARLVSDPSEFDLVLTVLPSAVLLVFLYWQVIPLLMAATGASLELRKLQAYPIPVSQLFSIETMLRITAGIEMALVLLGILIGVLFNPRLPKWCGLAIVPYILFNLYFGVGLRDLLLRILARKRIREVAFLLLVICAALPQLVLTRMPGVGSRLRVLLGGEGWLGWPWAATANLVQGFDFLHSSTILLAWAAAAGVFARWQFNRTLSFDADAARASDQRSTADLGLLEKFYRLPSVLLTDPLAALVEKEIRFLLRSPRFRLVFLMGFTFGLVIWLPIALGRNTPQTSFLGTNYLTVVSVYSVLLLSEVCFWNSFGFDRSAAQIYFLAPVPFSRVLIGKNLSAIFFIFMEISAVTTVCALLRMPLNFKRLSEAYAVAGVVSIFLLAAGNLLSIYQARAVNPATSFRSGAAGRVQAMLFVIYPIAFLPAALAYLARWAFDNQSVFFAVLALDAVAGLIGYRIALESAVAAADRLKERMVAALSSGDGPIAG
jgi:ABC-2 type transport system permease protein